ncbi:MAG: outer membrane protein transport protein [candidate division KSB1 bacterium]|nr:outer membrane protein transport protein [candidate division KSB1 bacterium]MDZ7304037.1 outer membrane protein transport protein [candidate division KSB1 bacterium]MDZ7313252.1 outer membrane protein transport protein [candidate division KSB1 bacterium]
MPNPIRARIMKWGLCPSARICLCSMLLLYCNIAAGQIPRPPVPQFSFVQLRLAPANPAARPASLGGAFIGIADDATAAAINPAGLSFLTRPEVSLSHALGQQARDYPVASSNRGIGTHRDHNPIFDQTLVNIAYPYRGFTFALYRQLAIHADFDFTRRQFLTFAPDRSLTLHEQLGAAGNFAGVISDFSTQVIHNALVVAKTLQRRLRLGFAVAATQFRLRLHESHYFDPNLWLQEKFNVAPTPIGENRAESLYRIYDLELNQFKFSWNAGILVELDPALTLGVVYQHLPTFRAHNRVTLPAYRLPDRTPNDGHDDEIEFSPQELLLPFKIKLPDKFGCGLAWKPTTKILMALDAVLHRNHSLLRALNMNLPQDDRLNDNGDYVDPDGNADVEAKNLISFHGGFEYSMITGKMILPIRCGFYSEPHFGLQAVATDMNLKKEYSDETLQLHFTSGIGIVLKNVRFEGSLDVSSMLIEAIGSAVVRF